MSVIPNCRLCGTLLTETFIDLGAMPLANSFITEAESHCERRYPLHARVCPNCLLVQVDHSISPDSIFDAHYAYFSSYSDSWVEHARRYADAMIARLALGPKSLVVEVASNDGYLLQHFSQRGVPVLGIEPAANVAQAAIAKGIATEIAFFGKESATRLASAGVRADLITANNVLAHVPDILDFASGFALLLKREGVATFEFPHVLNLVREVQFDTIYHEHYSYLSLASVERVFTSAGLRTTDVEEIPTHGGSLRVFAVRQDSPVMPSARVETLREKERAAGLDQLTGYRGFAGRVRKVKAGFIDFLAQAKAAGEKVAAYGAAAKGNTFLNYCEVTKRDIECVFERSAAKQGKLLPGSHIPVVATERLRDIKPDYLIILPWNLTDEIRAANAVLTSWGGRFVVAVPEVRVLS
jgi:SAM-dependent methyltransferase